MVQLSHPYMSAGKIIALIIRIFLSKVMSLLFTMLSRFVITFFPRSKCLSILWQKSTVSLEAKKIKSAMVSTFSPFICHEVMRLDAVILIFYMLYFKPAFILYSFTLIRKLSSSFSLSAIIVVSFAYLRLLIFLLVIFISACDSSSPVFHMMYFAYKLNKRVDNI